MDKTRIVYIMIGLPGSGKSTEAARLMALGNCRRVSRDMIRFGAYLQKPFGPYIYNHHYEQEVIQKEFSDILYWLDRGRDVIVDDTNMKSDHVERIKNLVEDRARVEIIDLRHVDLNLCIERDKHRKEVKMDFSVGEDAIRSMHGAFISPSKF